MAVVSRETAELAKEKKKDKYNNVKLLKDHTIKEVARVIEEAPRNVSSK